ncbi:MAG: DUF3052 family protein [Euryarchaeota archaeon]|nr:DUF3052 family protein [Euryarchaeota archaeon]
MFLAGYSKRSLPEKLGVKPGHRIMFVDEPAGFRRALGKLPPDVQVLTRPAENLDLVHVFVSRRARLAAALPRLMRVIRPEAPIWVSWPKKASGVETDVTEDVVRDVALPLGLVDVKVCAVDEAWSGLKLVIRKENRPKR